MKATCYLVLDAKGVRRMTKGRPDLYAGEIAVRITVEASDRHFRQPYAEATLTIGDEHLIVPEVNVDVAEPEVAGEGPPDG